MQIVIAAMIFVPLVFVGFVLVVGDQTPQNPAPIQGQVVEQQGAAVVERLALIVGLGCLFVQQYMGRFVTRQAVASLSQRAMHEPERLGEAYMTGLVVSAAINEMAAFLNLIAYMQSQSPLNLGMGLLLIASNATKMPTASRVAGWAETTAQRLRDDQTKRMESRR